MVLVLAAMPVMRLVGFEYSDGWGSLLTSCSSCFLRKIDRLDPRFRHFSGKRLEKGYR